ncbi:MAG TPA: hypothetical protein VEO53_16990 [Candidatus Binatia bacterium]|nr:hypothetical protein [Candidatus Binatia bacterium]
MKGLSKLVVVAMTAATLMLMAAVGAAATSGTLGSGLSAVAVTKALDNGKHKGECHPPKKTHTHGTPGHKNHPCGEDGDDSD